MATEVSIDIDAPIATVWADLANLDSHVEWMADADSLSYRGDQETGVGTVIEVLTKVGPLKTVDVLTFTVWEPPHTMIATHSGVVKGEGIFRLTDLGNDRTRFTWAEELDMPWYFGGNLFRPVSEPVLRLIWKKNLQRLADRF